jgi:uncharacterized membrane protein YjjP (DUF1212 family)
LAAPEETEGEERNTAAVAFVLRLARALHSYGYSAQRLEDILSATSDRLGLRGYQFFSTPTSIMASFGSLALQRTHMLRIEPGEVNLSKLAALEQVSYDVARGHVPPDEGSVAIERIVQASSPYGSTVTALAYGAVSGAACQFLGGGMNEIAVATTLGLGLGILALFARTDVRVSRQHRRGGPRSHRRSGVGTHRDAVRFDRVDPRAHAHHGDDRVGDATPRIGDRPVEQRLHHLSRNCVRRCVR